MVRQAIVAMALALAVPASAKVAETRPGLSEDEYMGITASELAAKFASECVVRKWIVISPVAPQVVCEDEEMSLLWERVAALTRRRTEVRSLVRFTMIPTGDKIHVQAGIFTEETSAFGQVGQRQAETSNDLQRILELAHNRSPSSEPLIVIVPAPPAAQE